MNDKALCDAGAGGPPPVDGMPRQRPGGIIIHPGCHHAVDALNPSDDDFDVPNNASNEIPQPRVGYFELARDTKVRDVAVVRQAGGNVFINLGVNIIEVVP